MCLNFIGRRAVGGIRHDINQREIEGNFPEISKHDSSIQYQFVPISVYFIFPFTFHSPTLTHTHAVTILSWLSASVAYAVHYLTTIEFQWINQVGMFDYFHLELIMKSHKTQTSIKLTQCGGTWGSELQENNNFIKSQMKILWELRTPKFGIIFVFEWIRNDMIEISRGIIWYYFNLIILFLSFLSFINSNFFFSFSFSLLLFPSSIFFLSCHRRGSCWAAEVKSKICSFVFLCSLRLLNTHKT